MRFREAELSLENRDEKIEEIVDEIENNLVLLGATGMHLLVLLSDNFFLESSTCTSW